MKRIVAAMGWALLMGMASPVMAADSTEPKVEKVDKHEGIEITVNINTANAEELDTLLVGIGPDKAAKIVQYRQANGLFESAESLSQVKGIGAATVEKNRARIKL